MNGTFTSPTNLSTHCYYKLFKYIFGGLKRSERSARVVLPLCCVARIRNTHHETGLETMHWRRAQLRESDYSVNKLNAHSLSTFVHCKTTLSLTGISGGVYDNILKSMKIQMHFADKPLEIEKSGRMTKIWHHENFFQQKLPKWEKIFFSNSVESGTKKRCKSAVFPGHPPPCHGETFPGVL